MFLSFLFKKKNPKDEKLRKQLKMVLGFKPKEILYYKMALRHASAKSKITMVKLMGTLEYLELLKTIIFISRHITLAIKKTTIILVLY